MKLKQLALTISKDPEIHKFANSMIRDHTTANNLALVLLKKLKVQPQDNFMSKFLVKRSKTLIDEMAKLRGKAFDKHYAENELAYHQEVVKLVGETFIPNIENKEVKALFIQGNEIFEAHEKHAQMMVKAVQ